MRRGTLAAVLGAIGLGLAFVLSVAIVLGRWMPDRGASARSGRRSRRCGLPAPHKKHSEPQNENNVPGTKPLVHTHKLKHI